MAVTGASQVAELKTIVITSSGGSGHFQAAHYKKSEIKRINEQAITALKKHVAEIERTIENPNKDDLWSLTTAREQLISHKNKIHKLQCINNEKIPQYDLLLDWAPLGHIGVKWNNGFARTGQISKQMRLVKLQKHAEKIYSPSVYVHLVKILKSSNIEHVIDTQPLSTKAICAAVHHVNWLNRHEIAKGLKKSITITKVLTDLPTEYSTHFFDGIQKLPNKFKQLLTIETIPPLLTLPKEVKESSLSSQEIAKLQNLFWRGVLGDIVHLKINYCPLPVRAGFHNKLLTNRSNIEQEGLFIKYNNKEEEKELSKLVDRGIAKWQQDDVHDRRGVRVRADATVRVMSLMLGSTGGVATFDYIDGIIERFKTMTNTNDAYMFYIFCGRHLQSGDLYDRVVSYIKEKTLLQSWPNHLRIVPLGGQGDLEIAPMFARSDTLIFRSGGLASMEVLTVAQPEQQLLIHSEITGLPAENQNWQSFLEQGMVIWEAGNAKYLCSKREAEIINCERFKSISLNFTQKKTVMLEEDHHNSVSDLQCFTLDNDIHAKGKEELKEQPKVIVPLYDAKNREAEFISEKDDLTQIPCQNTAKF